MLIKNIFKLKCSLLCLGFCLFGTITYAQTLKVAIAANLQPVIKVLQKGFKTKTGVEVEVISGPSGGLATQIQSGAPFDIFMSADVEFPQQLYQKGFTQKPPVIYASGALIICSNQKIDLAKWPRLLTTTAVEKIAIGNPSIAPYGEAAVEALKKAGLYETIKPKIVLGESITQVNTYIITGVVQAGFTTLALTKDPAQKVPLYYQIINPKMYSPIQQGMVLVKHTQQNINAEKFYRYILSPAAKKIFVAYGYHVP